VLSPLIVTCGKDDKHFPEKQRNINPNTLPKLIRKYPHQILTETQLLLIYDEEMEL